MYLICFICNTTLKLFSLYINSINYMYDQLMIKNYRNVQTNGIFSSEFKRLDLKTFLVGFKRMYR